MFSIIIRKLKWIGILAIFLILVPPIYFWNDISKYDDSYVDHQSENTAIVLGAALWKEEPSPALQERLDEAHKLYNKGQIKYIILSGGLGKGRITEAEGMRRYLISKGIPKNALLTEEKSSNTWQNLLYSSYILKKLNLSTTYIITHDYHMSRSMYYAHKIGIDAISMPVHSKVLFTPYHKFRESYALLKEKVKS